MKYDKILLTGGSGTLGSHIIKSGILKNLISPSRKEMDITKPESVDKFFAANEPDAVIHCAAMARVSECEQKPIEAVKTNVIGTANIVAAVIKKENEVNKKIRFIYISTDGVYQSTRGNYSETDEAIPYNKYGWTKLGGEAAVNLLTDFCIIRTRFFNPQSIKYDEYATDSYTSMIPVDELVRAIASMVQSGFVGTINIGCERKSDYDILKKYKPSIKPTRFEDVQRKAQFRLSKDASVNISLWKKIQGQQK